MTNNPEIDPSSVVARIIAELEDQPSVRALLLRAILSDELLRLPQQVARLTETVAEMARVFDERLTALESVTGTLLEKHDRTNTRLDGIAARLDGMDERFNGIAARLDGMDERFNGIDASLYGINASLYGIDARLEDIEARLNDMDECFNGIDRRFDAMDARFDSLEGNMSNLMGSDYERKAVRRVRQLVRRHLRINNGEILIAINRQNGRIINEIIDRAEEMDLITEYEADDFNEADIILQGQSIDDQDVYVVGEISITVGDDDVDRAHRRAQVLARASGAPARPVVIGSSISPANQDRADALQVSMIYLSA